MRKIENRSPDPSSLMVALKTASGPNYLGDPVGVDATLRMFVLDAVNRAKLGKPSAEAYRADVAAAQKLADIFLGKDPDYTPMPWNSPGQIDVFIATQLGALNCPVIATTPEQTLVNALLLLLRDIYSIIYCAAKEPDGYWAEWVDCSLSNFHRIFLGISIADEEDKLCHYNLQNHS